MDVRTGVALFLIVVGIWLNLLVQDRLAAKRASESSESVVVSSETSPPALPDELARHDFVASVARSRD
jgi:hypothetical protein